ALEFGIKPIDLVAVNLYQFDKQARQRRLSPADAIEYIDIGGPTMLRAAAKNFGHCLAVVDPCDYGWIGAALSDAKAISAQQRQSLAQKVFATIASYDSMIASYLDKADSTEETMNIAFSKLRDFRYG